MRVQTDQECGVVTKLVKHVELTYPDSDLDRMGTSAHEIFNSSGSLLISDLTEKFQKTAQIRELAELCVVRWT